MQFNGRSLRTLFVLVMYIGVSVGQLSSDSNYRTNSDRSNSGFSTERTRDSVVCMDVYPQRSVDMSQITGEWYGNEIIIHSQDVPGEFQYETCVVIRIFDMTEQMQNHHSNNDFRRSSLDHHQQDSQRRTDYHTQQGVDIQREPTKYLRLLWTEKDDTLQYIFNYTSDMPGRWSNVGEQQGSFVTLNHYTQFSGTVQVVKAVNDHLVLTFCGNDLKSTIYTIVLSRNQHGLSKQELLSIRTLLSNRHLSTDTIRKICSSGSAALSATLAIVLLLVVGIVIRKH